MRRYALSLLSRIAHYGALCYAAMSLPALAEDAGHAVQLERSGAGSLYIQAEIGGVPARFLVDTGAGMVTVDRALFKRMRASGDVREVRQVAARLANNRLQLMTVYEVSRLLVGGSCNLGPIEIAVMDGKGRNLMGLSALGRAAPFTIHTSPPSITLSGCAGGAQLAAAH
mgnify:FL=1